MHVRPATMDDLPALAAASADLFDAPVIAARLARYLAAPDHRMLIAILDGAAIGQARGMIQHHPDRDPELYIETLAVAHPHRRRGVARALLHALLGWGASVGCVAAWVGTELDNAPANALYRRLGRAEPVNLYLIDL
ncbi:ribosomal protein S18 acetylase RimI-like enzyme [Sphingomonas jejuensis]|uniref:Ribosomal protein S18 acetylase RimI-like enzyme n=1 Tax=Sphingomonas jejuensis TaxID=904715 RepID=A0ABX0XMI7_9SPHN|nr:GNAT family N-acetyltransferase [Sphingomonas jejuensis]NJC34593.1 ribosomal protein S18 acetylase RimI-like enzyme [Sphingomonas jejuensis]